MEMSERSSWSEAAEAESGLRSRGQVEADPSVSFDNPSDPAEDDQVAEVPRQPGRYRIRTGAYVGKEATIKKRRVVIGGILLLIILCMVLASFLPMWITVEKGGDSSCFGPYSAQFGGITQSVVDLVQNCQVEELEQRTSSIGEGGCKLMRDVNRFGSVVLGSYGAVLFCTVYGTAHLIVGRVRLAILLWFAAFVTFLLVTYVFYHVGYTSARLHGFTPAFGLCSNFLVAVTGLVVVDLMLVIGLWCMARDEWSVMGVDVNHFGRMRKLSRITGNVRQRLNQVRAPEYDHDVHVCGLGTLYKATESGLLNKKGCFWGSLHFLATVPAHFVKTFDWAPIRMSWFGPASEMRSVRKHGKVRSSIVVNYMIYRRANMICVVGLGLPLFLFRLSQLHDMWTQSAASVIRTARISFEDWQKQPHFSLSGRPVNATGFDVYTTFVAGQLAESLGANFAATSIFKLMVYLALLGLGVVCAAIATSRWYDFRFTRAMLNLGFVAMGSTTIFQVLCSFSGTHDFTHIDVLVEGYLYDLRDFVGVRSWTEACLDQNIPLMLATASMELASFCPKIPNDVYDFRTVPVYGQVADFRTIHHYCYQAKNLTQEPTVVKSVQFANAACLLLGQMIYENFTTSTTTGRPEAMDTRMLSQEQWTEFEDLDLQEKELEGSLSKLRARRDALREQRQPQNSSNFSKGKGARSLLSARSLSDVECNVHTGVKCGYKHMHVYDCSTLVADCDYDIWKCKCKASTCWSWTDAKCIPLSEIEADQKAARRNASALLRKYESQLDLTPAQVKQQLHTAIRQIEHVAETIEDAIDGLSNFSQLIMFVVGLGSGLIICAMTVKLIFANSTLPGRFIIAFPMFYCPPAFALYGLAWVVIKDAEFAFIMITWSFWPVLVSIAARWHNFHLPMSSERAMFMANYLLVFYYTWITASYIVLVWYALWWTPRDDVQWWEPEVWIQGKPQQLLYAYLANLMSGGLWYFYMCDNFTFYFMTCLCVGDYFIIAIVQEHKFAYREVPEGHESLAMSALPSGSYAKDSMVAVYRAEREMIEDWCTLIGESPQMEGIGGKDHEAELREEGNQTEEEEEQTDLDASWRSDFMADTFFDRQDTPQDSPLGQPSQQTMLTDSFNIDVGETPSHGLPTDGLYFGQRRLSQMTRLPSDGLT